MDKQMLIRCGQLRREIEQLEEEKKEYLACLGKAGGGDGMPHGGGLSDPTARAAFALAGYQERINVKLDELIELQDTVDRELSQLDPKDSLLLTLRYLCGLSWGAVAAAIYRQEEDYAAKMAKYIRKIQDRCGKLCKPQNL